MKNLMFNNQSHYTFRCLNTGLVQSSMSFQLRDTLNVNVKCKEGMTMSAVKLGASVAATAAALASLY